MRATPEPPSEIDLAREDGFALGALTIIPAVREAAWPDGTITVEPRVMQVLVRLVRANGGVVSRDDLIQSCWGGRIVGDDAINRCVAKVRQIAELGDGPHFTIETIPRVGYRLREEPRAVQLAANDSVPASTPGRRLKLTRIGAAVLICAALAGIGAWLAWPERQWIVVESRTFLESPPMVRHASFSPDGTMLTYSQGEDVFTRHIYIRNAAGGDAIQVTNDGYDDASASWSSDGDRIAYIASRVGEPCRIMVTTVPAGAAREVGRCRGEAWQTLSWRPNSNEIYYSDWVAPKTSTQAIFKLDLETGQQARVTQGSSRGDIEPRVSPDGGWLAYVRIASITRMELHLVNLKSGNDRLLAADRDLQSDAWTSDSRAVLAPFANWRGSQIRAYPIDGRPSYLVYSSSKAIYRVSASSTGLLAATVEDSQVKLARMTADVKAPLDVIDPTGGRTWSHAFAPDGTLAFASNRSGVVAIWIQKPGAKPVQLLSGPYLGRLNWSPDGRFLAFFEATDINAGKIKVVTASGTTVSTIATNDPGLGFPTWTPDSGAILLADQGQVWRVDVHDPARRTRVAGGEWIAVTIHDHKMFAAKVDKDGVWEIDGEPRLINAQYPMGRDFPIAFLGNDILVPLDNFHARQSHVVAQPIDGSPARTLGYLPEEDNGPVVVNPLTGEIIYIACAVRASDVDLLSVVRR